MNKQTEINLFIVSSIPRFYQQLLSGVANYKELGNRILSQIKVAHAFRQVEQVREVARILINVPIKEYQLIAQYYLVWCQCRELKFHNEVLESIADKTTTYKVKALSSRGTFEWYKGNNEAALYFYTEALKASPTVSEYIDLSKAIAVLKSQEGFHRLAVKDLEKLLPIIHHAEPLVYYEFLNSYAVELTNAGRLAEAESTSLIAISSPFGPYYQEWHDTFSEIGLQRKSRSTVAFEKPFEEPAEQPKAKILAFPTQQQEEQKEEPEPVQPVQAKPSYSINKYLFGEFNLRDKVDDWIHGETKADDLGTLAIALEECKDHFEKDMIIGQLVDAIFPYSPEAKEAKDKWYDRLRSRIK